MTNISSTFLCCLFCLLAITKSKRQNQFRNLDVKCSTTSIGEGERCYNNVNGWNSSYSFNHCDNSQRLVCAEDNEITGICSQVKKFYFDECSFSSECYTNYCESGHCQYKTVGMSCTSSKECDKVSYCESGTCKNYVLTEGSECSATSKCSPNLFCLNGKCVKKGTIGYGKKAEDASLCSSFSLNSTGYCDISTNYLNLVSQYFPSIKCYNIKLSDYSGNNYGLLEPLSFQVSIDLMGIGILSKLTDEDEECILPILYQKYLVHSNGDAYFTLPEKLMKRILGFPDPDEHFCKTSPDSDGKCFYHDEHLDEDIYQYCQKDDYSQKFCQLNLKGEGKCNYIPALLLDMCFTNLECKTGYCENTYCLHKYDGMSCERNDECGLTSYCKNGTCSQYVLEENGDCSSTKCSPRYVCVNNKCIKKGTLPNGKTAKKYAEECASFKMSFLKTCEDYDPSSTSYENVRARLYSEYFPHIQWEGVKLSEYDNEYMGNSTIYEEINYLNNTEKIKLYGESLYNCQSSVRNEFTLLQGEQLFTDDELRHFLDIQPKSKINYNISCSTDFKQNSCISNDFKEETFSISFSLSRCDKDKRAFCSEGDEKGNYKCKLGKFFHEYCDNDSDCLTGSCVNTKCAYLIDGHSCNSSSQCDVNSYCNNDSICTPYVLEENGNCSDRRCSPKYYCNSNNKCEKKGTVENGEEAENETLCKSFKLDPSNKCTDEYDVTKEDYISMLKAQYFNNITWEGKLSYYDSDNFGNIELYRRIIQGYEEIFIGSAKLSDRACVVNMLKENLFFSASKQYNLELNEENTREYLGIPPELQKDITCTSNIKENKVCNATYYNSSIETQYYEYTHCDGNEFCQPFSSTVDKCQPLKKFYLEKCEKSSECFTNNCVNGVCNYKEDNQTCSHNRECGVKSYCKTGKCSKYPLNGEDCSASNPCSPQFVCISYKCQPKGEIEVGKQSSNADLCKSFKLYNKVCNDNYNLSDNNDVISKAKSKAFPTIKWDKVKLSDYMGTYLGQIELIENYFEQVGRNRTSEFPWLTSETVNCSLEVEKYLSILKFPDEFSLSERVIKKIFLGIEEEEEKKEKSGLGVGIVVLIVVGSIFILGLVGFSILKFKKGSSELSSDKIDTKHPMTLYEQNSY